jgi:hypothetical protein
MAPNKIPEVYGDHPERIPGWRPEKAVQCSYALYTESRHNRRCPTAVSKNSSHRKQNAPLQGQPAPETEDRQTQSWNILCSTFIIFELYVESVILAVAASFLRISMLHRSEERGTARSDLFIPSSVPNPPRRQRVIVVNLIQLARCRLPARVVPQVHGKKTRRSVDVLNVLDARMQLRTRPTTAAQAWKFARTSFKSTCTEGSTWIGSSSEVQQIC